MPEVQRRVNRMAGVQSSRNSARRGASNRIRRGMQARAAAANGRHYDPGKMRYNINTGRNEYAGFDNAAYRIYQRARSRG